jgi:DNA-directed RNA polymerase II subunit RPB1
VYDTSETGYIQRRLVKAMEDAKIYYDQTVRNAAGSIIQFIYGEDGMEGTKIEQQIVPHINMDIIGMSEAYLITPQDNMKMYLTDAAFKEHSKNVEWRKEIEDNFKEIVKDREFLINNVFKGQQNDKIDYPIPFQRIIQNAVNHMKDVGLELLPSNMTPHYVLKEINELIKGLYVINQHQGTKFLHILIRAYLSPKKIICTYHLQKETFDYIILEVRRYFKEAIANAGEMVGIIAAQSLGEPATQLTLDSFHVSGTAAAVKATSGVPRLKELLSVSKNIKTPTLKIFLKPDISQTVNYEETDDKITDPRVMEAKERVFKVLHQLEITRLLDLLESTEIYWDPPTSSGLHSSIQNDDDILQIYREFMKVEPDRCRSSSCWVLRMKLNKEKLKRVHLNMIDIYMKIYQTYGNTLECIFSDDNDTNLIFHMRLRETAVKEIDTEDIVAALKAIEYNIVHTILLKGVQKIKKVSMRQYNHIRYNPYSQKFEKVNEWIMDTDGSNLIDIFSNPNIDPYRTVTNDIYEIYSVLGIEAARNALNNEIMEVIKESSVNQRHLYLLTDIMTCKGTLMPIDRHGINRGDVGPLAKSSFEETTDMLIKASRFGIPDRMNGVSANIMLGQMPPCGTGDSEILMDEDAYIQLIKDKNNIVNVQKTSNDMDPCGEAVLKMELPRMVIAKEKKKLVMKEIKLM